MKGSSLRSPPFPSHRRFPVPHFGTVMERAEITQGGYVAPGRMLGKWQAQLRVC